MQSEEQGNIRVKQGKNEERWSGKKELKGRQGPVCERSVCHAKGLGKHAMGNRRLEDCIKWSHKIKSAF